MEELPPPPPPPPMTKKVNPIPGRLRLHFFDGSNIRPHEAHKVLGHMICIHIRLLNGRNQYIQYQSMDKFSITVSFWGVGREGGGGEGT